jgi:hypothetical protein
MALQGPTHDHHHHHHAKPLAESALCFACLAGLLLAAALGLQWLLHLVP